MATLKRMHSEDLSLCKVVIVTQTRLLTITSPRSGHVFFIYINLVCHESIRMGNAVRTDKCSRQTSVLYYYWLNLVQDNVYWESVKHRSHCTLVIVTQTSSLTITPFLDSQVCFIKISIVQYKYTRMQHLVRTNYISLGEIYMYGLLGEDLSHCTLVMVTEYRLLTIIPS